LTINFPVLLAVLLWIVIDTKQGRRGIAEKNLQAKDSNIPEILVLFYSCIIDLERLVVQLDHLSTVINDAKCKALNA
jgi:hypothetical protein